MQVTSLPRAPLRLGRRLLGSSLAGALATPNPVDAYLALANSLWSVNEVRAEVESVRRQTPRSVTLTLRPNDNWEGFVAGRHVWLTLEIDGVLRRRSYSPACAARAGDRRIELTVTTHPDGLVSGHLAAHARPGMVLALSQAEGDFILPESRPDRLLLVSGGSGITPVMSMLRTLADEQFGGAVTFLHYTRGAEDRLYADELAALASDNPAFEIVHAHTRDDAGDLKGHFSRRHLKAVAPDFAARETFVCGPNSLIDALQRVWVKDGLAQKLHVERFVPPAPMAYSGKIEGTLTFAASGVAVVNDGRPILEQAEQAGLAPNYGCRMGICHTCVCKLHNGTVRDVRTGEMTSVTDEFVQICINAPVGDVEIEI